MEEIKQKNNKETFDNRKKRFRSEKPFKPKDEFETNVLDLSRVTRVTAGGRQMRFRAVIVVGDKKGTVGIGAAKGVDVQRAIEKATNVAKKNLIKVPIIKGTIPHPVEAKYGPSEVILNPQTKGRGLVSGGTVRVICSLAGIEDVSSKVISRTRNSLNNAEAVIKALKKLKKNAVKSNTIKK